MTGNEYQARANALAAPADKDVQERLVQCATMIDVYLTLINSVGNRLDEIKKFAFYNRQNDISKHYPSPFGAEAANQRLRDSAELLHAIMGIITESAELAEAYMKHINSGEPLDNVNLLEELGDVDWYKVLALRSIGRTNEQCQERNIEKLESRYKSGFTQQAANNRDLETERKILEDVKENANT